MEIKVRDVSYAYEDGKSILQQVSITAMPKQLTAILGHSGSGKSTLLRIISGLLKPQSGQVLLNACPVSGCDRERSVLSADTPLFPWMTVRNNLIFALKQYRIRTASQIAAAIIERLNMGEFCHKYPSALSSGMTKQAMLARALSVPAKILLLDEPLAEIDPQKRLFCHQLLAEATEQRTILLVTHDIDEALKLANTIYLLDKDKRMINKSWHLDDKHFLDDAVAYSRIKHDIMAHYQQNLERSS